MAVRALLRLVTPTYEDTFNAADQFLNDAALVRELAIHELPTEGYVLEDSDKSYIPDHHAYRVHAVGRLRLAESTDFWYFIATESGNPDIADRFVDTVTERFVLLGENPHMGRRRDEGLRPGVRTFPVGRYVILYRILPNSHVLIIRVIPGERDIPSLLR